MGSDTSGDIPDIFDGSGGQNTGPYFTRTTRSTRSALKQQESFPVPQTWDEHAQGQTSFGSWGAPGFVEGNPSIEEEVDARRNADESAFNEASEDEGGSSQDEILISEAESDFEIHGLLDDIISGQPLAGQKPNVKGRGGARGRSRGRLRGRARGKRVGERGRSIRALHNEDKRQRRTGVRGNPKGAPKGPRKPLEPSAEFKKLHSQAMAAFIEGDYDLAEDYVSQAILDNPEIFTAHSLLSEIHMAQGDKQRALTALFHGAHTRPRDQETWSKVAELMLELAGEDRIATLPDAIYCYNRVIGADGSNVDARYRRAALSFEAGKLNKAAYDYLKLLEILPNDVTVLRHLAETFIAMEDSEQAIPYYDKAIVHYKKQEPDEPSTFTWSDANIYAELFLFSNRSVEGLMKVKQVSRWLLGRGVEAYWDAYQNDDREFDAEDFPRRAAVPEFVSDQYPEEFYGEGLPMELRIKLAIFRLKLGGNHPDEAMRHFSWLHPENAEEEDQLYDYPDLFRETADVLSIDGRYEAALRFYEPLERVENYANAQYYKAMALCYRHLSQYDKAESCYRAMRDHEAEDGVEAEEELASMFVTAGFPDRAKHYYDHAMEKRRHRRRPRNTIDQSPRRMSAAHPDEPVNSIEPFEPDRGDSIGALFHQASTTRREKAVKQSRAKEILPEEKQFGSMFENMQTLLEASRAGDIDARAEWMSDAKMAIDHFSSTKVFFPYDKHIRFLGYSSKARAKAMRPKARQKILDERLAARGMDIDSDEEEIPTTFCGVSFRDWFDCFMEYALLLAKEGDRKSAYAVARLASNVNIFYHDKEAMFTIHIIWSMCAVVVEDHETLCAVTRYFMKEYQFVTDSYRLFSALNRNCNRGNIWYNNGPTQKFALRQVKAVDYSLIDDKEGSESLYDERARYVKKDEYGNDVKAKEMDVTLLVLYGHMLYYGESYVYSLNYFYRALALDPDSPLVNLSLGLGYIHYALKRQSTNRQYLIMQGLSFLFKYHDRRVLSENPSERQEAHFNIAKTFHMLGLLNLAIPYYENAMKLSETIQAAGSRDGYIEDLAKEAAYALRSIYAIDGGTDIAREITEKWLTL